MLSYSHIIHRSGMYNGNLFQSNLEASFVPIVLGSPYYGGGYIMVRGENTCGSSIPVAIGYGPCGYFMSFTPNPANNETTLSIESLSKSAEVDESVEWDMEIYNQTQGLTLPAGSKASTLSGLNARMK